MSKYKFYYNARYARRVQFKLGETTKNMSLEE